MRHAQRFAIESRWPHPPVAGSRDVASISIHLGDRALTRLFDGEAGQTRDFVRASAVSLAFWFVDNWWRLRWEPIPDYANSSPEWRLRHELTSVSGGTTWPPLMIYGVGERVVIAPIAGFSEAQGPIEYLPILVSVMPALMFETGVDAFFENVLTTCARAQDGDILQKAIQQLIAERQDEGMAAWRRLEAKLGYDPDEAPPEVIEGFSGMEERYGAEAVEEAAIGSPGPHSPEAFDRAIAASEASRVTVDLTAAAETAEASSDLDLTQPIWRLAEDAASRLRRATGLSDGPLHNRALGELLRVRWEDVKSAEATARDLPYGARLRGRQAFDQVALQTRSAHDRRFELARVLGDVIWTSHGEFGIVSRGKTDRQKFQRAFAQSLLCPFEDLRHSVNISGPTVAEIETAARRFHVHVNVVRTLLVNKGFLPRETLSERLEAA